MSSSSEETWGVSMTLGAAQGGESGGSWLWVEHIQNLPAQPTIGEPPAQCVIVDDAGASELDEACLWLEQREGGIVDQSFYLQCE